MDTVNGLWFGKIKALEELTLRSFAKYAEFHLWTYEDIEISIPNVVVKDGREILPEEDIFLYPPKMDLPFGGNSIVGFSERFRYKVLYEKGGWWSDLDVTCLKPLNEIKTDYFFRDHGRLPLVANIMKCPPKSELMKKCYEASREKINESTTDWHLAMKIMANYVEELDLMSFIRKDMCNIDRVPVMEAYYKTEEEVPCSWHFIHWMNTLFDRRQYATNSVYGKLLKEYGIKAPRLQLL
jgi:hypothetical protein